MKKFIFLVLLVCCSTSLASKAKLSPSEIVKKAEDNIRGDSQEGRLTMEIISGAQKRSVRFDFWAKGRTKTLIKIIEPIKEAGSGNLRIDFNLWRYLANVDRVVKIPPSMMLQSWMGSDFTNDDMVRTSSLYSDYTHTLKNGDSQQATVECTPKPGAPVVWGKVIETVRMKGFVTVKRQFVNEKGDIVKTMIGEDIRPINGHFIPFKMTMTNHKKDNSKTVLQYEKLKFNASISDDLFTQKKMKER